MEKREAAFTTKLEKWLLYNCKFEAFKLEVKCGVDNKPFNFNSGFKPHQLPTLIKIQDGPFVFKHSDAARLGTPYDLEFSCKCRAAVVMHWVRRGNKKFYFINPKHLLAYIEDGHKSITEDVAAKLATHTGELGLANITQIML